MSTERGTNLLLSVACGDNVDENAGGLTTEDSVAVADYSLSPSPDNASTLLDGSGAKPKPLPSSNIREVSELSFPEQHVPASHPESMLGKRKFQPYVQTAHAFGGNDESKLRKIEVGYEEEAEEAGLSLLFAASLLQQKDAPTFLEDTLDAASVDAAANAAASILFCPSELAPSEPEAPSKAFRGTTKAVCSSSGVVAAAASATKSGGAIEPTDNDVLCGRGGGINKHFGNIIYRRLVEYNKKVYKQVPKRHRMLVSRSIVQAILNSGGRFLQERQLSARTEWTEILFRRAVQKTSQALRERSDDAEMTSTDDTAAQADCNPRSLPADDVASELPTSTDLVGTLLTIEPTDELMNLREAASYQGLSTATVVQL